MIYITGDTHIDHDIHKLSVSNFPEQKKLTKDDCVIICGDFGGVWDGSKTDKYWQDWLVSRNFTTLFVDGNHENFDLLKQYPVTDKFGGPVQEIAPSVYHLCRGGVFHIDGAKFFVMGGAASHDKMFRKEGVSWWREEIPSIKEMYLGLDNLEREEWKVDYILTHCAPNSIEAKMAPWYEQDPLTSYLQQVMDRCDYKRWYFGHYHVDKVVDERHIAVYNCILPLEVT